jgi:hypothetical protein
LNARQSHEYLGLLDVRFSLAQTLVVPLVAIPTNPPVLADTGVVGAEFKTGTYVAQSKPSFDIQILGLPDESPQNLMAAKIYPLHVATQEDNAGAEVPLAAEIDAAGEVTPTLENERPSVEV